MLKVIVVGKMKNRAMAELCADYICRLEKFCKIDLVEVKDSDIQKEGEKILNALKTFKGKVYALGEEGKTNTSIGLSKILEKDLLSGGSAFIIGGAYGLSAEVKKCADAVLSLSEMTFTHEFARAILLEQLYRAKNISAKTGYHHE